MRPEAGRMNHDFATGPGKADANRAEIMASGFSNAKSGLNRSQGNESSELAAILPTLNMIAVFCMAAHAGSRGILRSASAADRCSRLLTGSGHAVAAHRLFP